jgi:hypothetical protein
MASKAHWESVYGSKAPEAVSWYQAHLERSLRLIEPGDVDRRRHYPREAARAGIRARFTRSSAPVSG